MYNRAAKLGDPGDLNSMKIAGKIFIFSFLFFLARWRRKIFLSLSLSLSLFLSFSLALEKKITEGIDECGSRRITFSSPILSFVAQWCVHTRVVRNVLHVLVNRKFLLSFSVKKKYLELIDLRNVSTLIFVFFFLWNHQFNSFVWVCTILRC